MSERRRLPQRRPSTNFDIESQGLRFTVTSTIINGELREIFITNHHAGSGAGIMASDAAVVTSIALQFGVPVEIIRKALMRDAQGRASGPLGVALDTIVAEQERAP